MLIPLSGARNELDSTGKKWEEILANNNFAVFTNNYAVPFCNWRNFQSCIDIGSGTPSVKHLLSDSYGHTPCNKRSQDLGLKVKQRN